MAVCLSKCARSGKLLLTDRASRDVSYLLQCLNRCAAPPTMPQEMFHTCSASRDVPHLLQCLKMCHTCSASTDVQYLLQCLKRCATPAVPQQMCRTSCSARHFITFRTHVTDSRCSQSVLLLLHSLLTVHSRTPTPAAAVPCFVASVCIRMNLH